MKTKWISVLCAALLFGAPLSAEDSKKEPKADPKAGGTLKGAAIGGLAGSAVGHPGTGAVVVGAVGHHKRHRTKKESRRQEKVAENNRKG